ncbi:unnamed protein product [Heligmosomoides polygyrus]|uniref:Ovule protein n=1 Tax=Heligmosomoides polygyrus TaxID=6339 RepID=A0A3P8B1W7_HELPZ|nr:unnamed protein product [Heligmosomoides polygyrus]
MFARTVALAHIAQEIVAEEHDEEERLRWDNDWSLDTSGAGEYTGGNSLPVNAFNATPLSSNSHVPSEKPELPATIQLSLKEQPDRLYRSFHHLPNSRYYQKCRIRTSISSSSVRAAASNDVVDPVSSSFLQANMPPTIFSPSRPPYKNITPKPPQQFVPPQHHAPPQQMPPASGFSPPPQQNFGVPPQQFAPLPQAPLSFSRRR